MSLGVLITFIGLLLAAYSVVRQPYRQVVRLFISPTILMVVVVFSSLSLSALIVVREYQIEIPPYLSTTLELAPFYLPLLLLLDYGIRFSTGRIFKGREHLVRRAWLSARNEQNYEGIRWLIEHNLSCLTDVVSPTTLQDFFDDDFIGSMVRSHSWIHLEMLSQPAVLETLSDRRTATDLLIRALLSSQRTPIHNWVLERYGGDEYQSLTNAERLLINATFSSPSWYMKTAAAYPLVIQPIERLNMQDLADEYNADSRYYSMAQGVAKRSSCPIWTSSKVMVLAIRQAIILRNAGDMYVSNLRDLFQAVLDRSRYPSPYWDSKPFSGPHPTPFAHIMHSIASDLNDLAREACKIGLDSERPINRPESVAQLKSVASTWAYSVASAASSSGSISEKFKEDLILEYVEFMLQIGWSPHDALLTIPRTYDMDQTRVYKDFLGSALWQSLAWSKTARSVFHRVAERLDRGKSWVCEGEGWFDTYRATVPYGQKS